MPSLFVFGYGYTSAETARSGDFAPVIGTVRTPEKAARLDAEGIGARVFGPDASDPRIPDDLARTERLLVSIPPGPAGDPALAAYGDAIAAAPRLDAIVYLSTIGVYGDSGGAWIDEETPPAPEKERGTARVLAEEAWLDLGARTGKRVLVLRLGGIYGPGRNPIRTVLEGKARRIVKPGQVFNRIHVADIAQAIRAAFERGPAGRIVNVVDDEPAPPQDVVAHAAGIAGMPVPPDIPFEEADLTPMGRSFYSTSKRVRNTRLKQELGVRLLYPSYREGLAALAHEA